MDSNLKPVTCDDRNRPTAWRLALQYADPQTPFPCPVTPNADGVDAMASEQGPGSTATVQIFKSVHLPVESAHSPFGHTQ